MKRLFISFIASLCVITAFAATQHYKLNVGQFDRLSVYDNVNVVYRCMPDSAGYVVFDGEDEFADAFIFTNNNGNLKIQVNTEDVGKDNLPVIYAYSDFITGVENSSQFSVRVDQMCPVPKFTAKLIGNGEIIAENLKCTEVTANLMTGNGRIIISGETKNAKLKMVGVGLIQADLLEAKNVKCKIMGSGTIGCYAIDNLDIRGIGTTKIYYKGNPEIKKVGGGKVYPLTSETSKMLEEEANAPQSEEDLEAGNASQE